MIYTNTSVTDFMSNYHPYLISIGTGIPSAAEVGVPDEGGSLGFSLTTSLSTCSISCKAEFCHLVIKHN